jgi:hypothetical protein
MPIFQEPMGVAEERNSNPSFFSDFLDDGGKGAPDRIRTCDRRIRNPLLYPAELRARHSPVLASAAGCGKREAPAEALQFLSNFLPFTIWTASV